MKKKKSSGILIQNIREGFSTRFNKINFTFWLKFGNNNVEASKPFIFRSSLLLVFINDFHEFIHINEIHDFNKRLIDEEIPEFSHVIIILISFPHT